jgi:hypothetical protein
MGFQQQQQQQQQKSSIHGNGHCKTVDVTFVGAFHGNLPQVTQIGIQETTR